jgi:hypothetical protein
MLPGIKDEYPATWSSQQSQGFDLYGVVSKFGTPIHPMVYQFLPFILPSLIIVGYPQSLDKAKTIAYS